MLNIYFLITENIQSWVTVTFDMAKDLKKGPAKKGKKATLGKQKLKGKNPLIHGKGKKATLKFNRFRGGDRLKRTK